MLKKILLSLLCFIVIADSAAFGADFRFSPGPNRAHLVQWRAWGPAALAEAKKLDRPVLLSISAVWCHWCHVMDETTYSDEAVIAYLNEHFLPVRLDADQRPDVDGLYNQGGWPSTVVLTPGGDIIAGGNYLTPQELLEWLGRIADVYATDRGSIAKRIEDLRQRSALRGQGSAGPAGTDDADAIVGLLQGSFDREQGGFGTGQKFPDPDALDFLLAVHAGTGDSRAKEMAVVTLDRMAAAALYDRVEGGFFRYATQPDWSSPHYEKMLEVNAGLIRSYANAALMFRSERYRKIVRQSTAFVLDRLFDRASGALYGSMDADESYYQAKDRRKLKQPAVDQTVYADGASLMISAFASAWAATGDASLLKTAGSAADLLMGSMYRPGDGVLHWQGSGRAGLPGLLNDNALYGSALLDLYEATGERRWLDRAGLIGQFITKRFYDPVGRRFRATLAAPDPLPAGGGGLAELNDYMANCRAIRFLARLASSAQDKDRRRIVEAALATLAANSRQFSTRVATYGLALRQVVEEPMEITIVAEGGRAREYLAAVGTVFLPEKVVRIYSPTEDREEIRSYGYKPQEAVYLCRGKRCAKPVKEPRLLAAELRRFLGKTAGPQAREGKQERRP